jgi:hypothetical protein
VSDWADYRQNREIRELQSELSTMGAQLASARSSTRRLQSELSKVTGSLEQRLNRLSAAFDAFVEISDLRITLALFDAHARVRHRARQLYGESPLPGELSDVDGYWLAPAVAAARATVDGQPVAPHRELANRRDARRATLFHLLATSLLGRPDPAGLGEVLPELEATVPMYQRALWTLAAGGHFGAQGRDLVLRRGVAALATLPDAARDSAVAAWQAAVRPQRDVASELPKELGLAQDLIGALDACERLAVLRHWVTDALAKRDDGPGEVDPMVKRTLELLVDEGSPLELPLLVRERELRQIIESGGAGGEPQTWESPVGSLVELLRKDIDDEDRLGRRTLAVEISAAHLLEAADRFAERARRPLGERTRMRTSHGELEVTTLGPVQTSMDRAMRRAAAAYAVESNARTVGYVAGGIGILLVVLGIAAGWGWLIPAVVALAVAGWQLHTDRTERATAAESTAGAQEKLRETARVCVDALNRARSDLKRRQLRIDEDLAELRAALAGSSAIRGVI